MSVAADLQSLSLTQENGQPQANAPVYQQNGKSVPTAVPGRVASLRKNPFPGCLCALKQTFDTSSLLSVGTPALPTVPSEW